MTELFMKLLNMSINAGWLVLAVLLVRIMFHKAPKWLFPLLWSFVWIRLLMPNALESRLSVIPDISGFSASEQGLLSANGQRPEFAGNRRGYLPPQAGVCDLPKL